MNPILVSEIADLALALAENHMKKEEHQGLSVAATLLQIIEKSVQAYLAHTGKPVPPSIVNA